MNTKLIRHEREGGFERKLKEDLAKTRGQKYKKLPRKQKIAYLVFIIFGFWICHWFFYFVIYLVKALF